MQVKLSVSSPSLSQLALTSQGSLRQGSGTVYNNTSSNLSHHEAGSHSVILEQVNPSPTVNGAWHEQLKFSLSKPSLTQSALGSHSADIHGSGTDG